MKRAWLLVAWALGMALVHRPMLTSGFKLHHGDPGDARFVNYILEHGWRWLLGRAPDASFWDMPFFHPAKNVGAFSEVMVGVGPFYWVWRAIGFDVDTSAQLWTLTCATLNLVAAYVFLSRVLRFGALASAVGGFVFAFALARSNQLNHPQLLSQFWSVFALHALARALLPPDGWSRRRRRLAIATFFACVALQLWSGFYTGWFFGLGLGIALAWSLVFAAPRKVIVAFVREEPLAIAGSALLALVVLAPMTSHYLAATRDVGVRSFEHVAPMIPRAQSWLHMGSHSWWYARTATADVFARIPTTNEHRIGVGVLTTVVWIAGLVIARRRPALRVVLFTSVTIVLLATATPDGLSLWRIVYALVPGAKAIRAVARIGLLMLLPVSIGVAAFVDAVAHRSRAVAGVALLVVLEQGTDAPMFDKLALRRDVAGLVDRAPPGCGSVLFSPMRPDTPWYEAQIDGMFAAERLGIPTINGYSGNHPSGWDLDQVGVRTEADRARIGSKLDEWARIAGLDRARICWVVGSDERR